MKKLLKNVICEIREQCMGILFTVDKSTIAGWKKKKITKHKRHFKLNPNRYKYRKEMILAHGHGTHWVTNAN